MARPRKSDCQEMATEKIERVFWALLETEPYSEITVLRIVQEAGVNHNTFYYHYKDINDLAYQAFMHNADNEVSRTLFAALISSFQLENGKPFVFDLSLLPYTKRIMLCAASDSPFLTRITHDLLKDVWLSSLQLKEDMLSPAEKVQVNFIFAGLVATLGSPEIQESPLLLSVLVNSELGHAMVTTLKKVASRLTEE